MNYEDYEDLFNPLKTDRQARRKRKPRVNHQPKKSRREIVNQLADLTTLEGDFETTYKPSLYEAGWLLQSLRPFYDQSILLDIQALVKGGKEASVYRCAAHPSSGMDLIAAKVYRPRQFRSLSSDNMYREGREVLKDNGKAVKRSDHRIMRAMNKKTSYGVQVAHTSWLMHEYTTLETLHQIGAAVPKPIAASDNAILMGYVGDENLAAPTLNEVDLEPDEARDLFREVLRNVELMLRHGMIHGDLSAYNILYLDGEITLIDFPQVTNSHTNTNAHFILRRDILRICEYFHKQGVAADPDTILDHLWERYIAIAPEDLQADLSRMEADDEE